MAFKSHQCSDIIRQAVKPCLQNYSPSTTNNHVTIYLIKPGLVTEYMCYKNSQYWLSELEG